MPTTDPPMIPIAISAQLPMPSRASVVPTAMAMPVAAMRFPCFAVVGCVPRRIPKMNIENATM
jgi:hypothetical protein